MDSLQTLFKTLKVNGFHLNEKRILLITLLEDQNKFITVQKLKNLMQRSYPDISLDMIYRCLSILESFKLVYVRYNHGEKHYFLSGQLTGDLDIAYFLCEKCSKVTVLPYSFPESLLAENVNIQHCCFEIYGTCRSCSSALIQIAERKKSNNHSGDEKN
jgi:Fe2+ or Zn2+ uptake regulation protein